MVSGTPGNEECRTKCWTEAPDDRILTLGTFLPGARSTWPFSEFVIKQNPAKGPPTMLKSPYCPPHCNSSPLYPDVDVRSRFPLDITGQRTIVLNISDEILEQRVQLLARSCGFAITNRSERNWTLQRGSLWHALYTFHVRKLPTTVALEMISAKQLSILLRCRSVLTVATPGDAKRISQELDELETQFAQVE